MEPVFVIGILSSIPIVAIWTRFKLKLKRMELEQGLVAGNAKRDAELVSAMQLLNKENQELRKRLENIETIVSLGEANTNLNLSSQQDLERLAQQGNELAKIALQHKK